MQAYSFSIVGILVVCLISQSAGNSTAKVSINGETWRDEGPGLPKTAPPPSIFRVFKVQDGPGFMFNESDGCVAVLHGNQLNDAKPLSLPVKAVSSIALSSDGKMLFVGSATDWSVWAFPLGRDGMPTKGRRTFDLALPARVERLSVHALTTDTSGRLYAATASGIQVFDRGGKIVEILSGPAKGKIQNLFWSGPKRDVLMAMGEWGFSTFSLKLKAIGTEE